MRSVRMIAIAACLTTLFAISQANAGLIIGDLSVPGDGLLTIDAATSLEWLDLTATVGQTRSSVLSGSFTAAGFRYATQSEVVQLWEDAGASGGFGNGNSFSSANFAPANLLISLLGCTSQFLHSPCDAPVDPTRGDVQHWNIGFWGSDPTDAAIVDTFWSLHDPRFGEAALWIDFGTSSGIDIFNRPDVGSYLVRSEPVPEPATLALFGSGLTGVATFRRRKKKAAGQVAASLH